MNDTEATNWLVENKSDYVLVAKSELRYLEFKAAKQTAFKIGADINKDTRLSKLSKSFAVAITLNHLQDLSEEYEEEINVPPIYEPTGHLKYKLNIK